MELRALGPDCLETLYPAYLEAFSDYVIPVRPSFEAFASMLERRGANWERSIGAFDGDRHHRMAERREDYVFNFVFLPKDA